RTEAVSHGTARPFHLSGAAVCRAVASSRCCSTTCEFFFIIVTVPTPTELYTLSLHDALPISHLPPAEPAALDRLLDCRNLSFLRSEEHTSELQSRSDLVCRLLLEKKKSTFCGHRCHGFQTMPFLNGILIGLFFLACLYALYSY